MGLALALLLALSAGWGCAAPRKEPAPGAWAAAPSPSARAQAAPPPRLVTIVVDQLGGWVAEERWPALPPSGGFARLVRQGTLVRQMRYAHAITETAPGHSALYTGAPPCESGIAVNETMDRAGERHSILRDAATDLVTTEGVRHGVPGSSLRALRVETLADRLRAARPDAVVLSFSLKDRGALFAGGRKPTAALWLDVSEGRFATSTAFARALPAWASALADPRASDAGKVWTPLDPGWVASHAATPDAQPGEGDAAGLGTVFPHALAGTAPFAKAWRTTPLADDRLFALALTAVDAEPTRERPTLLALSLSANDYIGHTFGPDSWEAWDELERLDASLGKFLDALDARWGPDGYAVLLTGDHGVTTMPEAALVSAARPYCARGVPDPWQRSCGRVARLLPAALQGELAAAARRALGEGVWIAGVDDPYVVLTEEARTLPEARRRLLDEAVVGTLRAHAEIADVVDARTLPAQCPARSDESLLALVCRSYARLPEQPLDFYVVPRPGSFFDPDVVVGKGTSHGTPYLYDRTVPLVAAARGRVPEGRVLDEPVDFGAFSRTAASLLGVPPPDAARSARNLSRP